MCKKNQKEEDMLLLKYRFFWGTKYSLRGTAHWGPSDIVPQIPGYYAYPSSDNDCNIFSGPINSHTSIPFSPLKLLKSKKGKK